jgi:methylated-DNA-[protein]-cysteine S-methyltransferase
MNLDPAAVAARNPLVHPRMIAQAPIDTPLGVLTAGATADGLAGLWFDDQAHHPGWLGVPMNPAQRWIAMARDELQRYFRPAAGSAGRARFDVPLDLHGTDFQRAVWQALRRIAPGHTRTYGEIAAAAGRPAAVRAAGAAIGRNPAGIVVPCHRVIGRDGSLTGYAAGLERKRALLVLEGVLPAGVTAHTAGAPA